MSHNSVHSPYTLQLHIHNCEALPIADITSSDPYVVIIVGGRLENRTKTIFRNRNPVWNEEFSLKILHRRSVIALEIYDEDKGKDDDQIGTVYLDLTDLPLEVPIRKKYSVTASGGFDTNASKIEVTMTIRSNESVIQIVPDEKIDSTGEDNNSDSSIVVIDHAPSPVPDTDTSSSIDSELNDIVDSLVREHSTFKVQESVINALTSYITQDRARFFSKEMLQDLLWDASSLIHSDTEAAELLRTSSRDVYNRTQLRVLNASRLILSSKKCSWHPPIPLNSLQLNLLANDSKFITIQFTNRLSMWVCTRWLVLLHDVWKGFIKASELPTWASGGLYTTHCTVQRSDGHSISGAMVLARERPFELRVKNEFTSFKNLHNIVMSADSLKPKEYLMDIEVLSFGATAAEESVHEENVLEEEVLADSGDAEKGKSSSPKKGIFNKMNRAGHGLQKAVRRASLTVAHAGMGAVTGVADVAVGAAAGVAGSTLGAARSLVTGHPTDILHQAQDDLLSVGQNFRSFLHDATSTLAHPATYTVAKFDHSVMPASSGEHVYIDLNEDSFVERTLRRTRSEIVSSDETPLQDDPDRKFPDMNRTDAEISFLLCHNHSHNHSHSAQQGLLSHKRLTAQMLRQNEGVVYEVPLNVRLDYKIELIHSRGLQLASPGRAAASAKNMYVKMKIVDRHGNSKPLGHLQEVKTASFAPTPDPDWHSNGSFPAQEGFDRATYLRIEVCVEDFTSHYTIGSCFVPLNLFRKKSQEYTFPMTPFKQHAVQACDNNVNSALGETTFRIHRVEEEVPSSAVMTIRPRLMEANVFNTRWYCECLLAGSVNSEHSKAIEEFSLMPSMEGLELVATGRVTSESAHEQSEVPSDDHSTSSGLSSPASPYAHITRVTPIAVAAEPSAEPIALSTDWTHGAEHETYEIEIEVYENQRRQAFYPFDWSAEAKTRPAFSDLSYDVHYTFPALSAAAAPEGFEWKTEWCLDKTHISTDPHGWMYGYTFGTILSKYKQGKSRIKSAKMMARRRKWVRRAVSVSTGHKDTSVERNTAHQFAKANSLDGVQIMDTSVHSEDENSPHSPSSPMPKSPTSSLTSSEATTWRNEVLSHSPKALIAVCQERYSSQSHVLIPWEQVKDAYVVSPSVLSIYVTVHRYMADHTTHAAGCFRAAEVEIFVSNCPAVELKSMIDERKWFSSFKSQIRTLVQAGHVSGKTEALIMGRFLSTISEEDVVPQTEDLSLGSELVADLSENSIVLEARVHELDSYLGAHNVKVDNQTTKEKSIILRRDCRLRVYMAALFGMGLEGHHHYLENEVRAIMKRDFLLAQHIQQDTEVATANNRIEFYLDTAETRIRDAILCGWNYRDSGKLQRTLEIFANGYFIEIVGLLGSFFEDNGKTAVKGLGSKVGLINTYLKHNDRLATIIDHALRPYALRTQPAATLSLFLDFNILVSWYTSVLLAEMRQRADHVLNVWKDPTKDVTDKNSEYLYAVPWVPLHTEHKNTQFFTQIPEDLAEVLTTYLQHARVHKDTVAPSFHDSVGRLDGEVLTAYTSSFLHLCEQMTVAVESKDWAASEIEEELAEYATWLASVANDAHRVEANQLYAPSYVTHAVAKNQSEEKDCESSELDEVADQEEGIEKRTLKAFHRLAETALDHLCCIVFVYVFHERPHLLRDQLYTTWVETLPELDGGVEVEPIIPAIMEDVVFFLEGKQAFLNPFCYWKLVSLTAEKVFILYLSLFKSAHQAGAVFSSREITQIRVDIAAMKDGLLSALEKSPSESDQYLKTAHAIVGRFAVLESCCELFECDIASQQLDSVIKQLVHTAERTPADATGMAGLLETCLGLKGVLRYTARTLHASRTVTPRASMASGSSFTDLIAAVSAGRPESTSLPATPSPTKTLRRRSIFGSFFVREPSPEPIAFSHTALPRTQSMRLPTKEEGALLAQRAMAMSDAEIAAEAQKYEEEKEQEMVRLANEIREQALIDCFALMIQDLRNHAPVTHTPYTSLTQSSSLERVFGTDSSSEFPLEVQLLHSAHPPSSDHHRAASTRIGRLGGSLQRLFHSPKKEW